MSNVQQAASEAKRLAAMFAGLAVVAEHLDRASSLEEAINAGQAKVREIDAEIAKREQALADVDAAIESNKKKLAAAKTEASDIVQSAKSEAQEIVSKARMHERDIERSAKARIEEAAGRVDSMEKQLAGANEALGAVREQIAAEEQKLAEARAKLADLLGK